VSFKYFHFKDASWPDINNKNNGSEVNHSSSSSFYSIVVYAFRSVRAMLSESTSSSRNWINSICIIAMLIELLRNAEAKMCYSCSGTCHNSANCNCQVLNNYGCVFYFDWVLRWVPVNQTTALLRKSPRKWMTWSGLRKDV
jgi:hypothetical protein